jgi:glycosyltransferase involved in cell wall biosynthesis
MEGFACGLPAIVPGIGDIPILMGDSPPGFIFKDRAFDKIPNILSELKVPALYKQMSELAVKRARDFDINSSVELMKQVIFKVLQ